MMFVSFNINTVCFTSDGVTAHLSGAHEFTPVFNGVRFAQSLVFYVVYFC